MTQTLAIRSLHVQDTAAAGSILAAAFDALNPDGMIERVLGLAPETSWLALVDGIPAGLLCAVQYGTMAYVGPMGVLPKCQGRGIGRALMERLVECLEARGCRTMLLDATAAGEPLYRKFGFIDDGITLDMNRDPGAGLSTLPGIEDGLDDAIAVDQAAFGACRSHTIRWLLYDERAGLFWRRRQGYLIAQSKVLGPFTAITPETARQLTEEALAAGAVASRVLAPRENPDALELFTQLGFRTAREVLHMRRGPVCDLRRDRYYSLASFALG